MSRGKHQLFRFGDGSTLHTHFKMEGSWHLYRPGSQRKGGPDHQIRAILSTAHWEAVGYRLPVVEIVPTDREDDVVGHIGPDLLDPAFDADEALRRLAKNPARSIGEALLDQRNLAGIGTVYRAETLFLSGIHPRRPVGEIADLTKVVERARRLLSANKDRPEQSTTGDLRRGRQHWVFERARESCRRCGARIARRILRPPRPGTQELLVPVLPAGAMSDSGAQARDDAAPRAPDLILGRVFAPSRAWIDGMRVQSLGAELGAPASRSER